jgi:hypothetical protein
MVAMKFKKPKAPDSQTQSGLIVGTGGISRFSKIKLPKLSKKKVLLVAGGLVLSVGIISIYYFNKRGADNRVQTVICNEKVDSTSMEQAVNKMQQQTGFDRDPSCLYVLVNYYISRGDPENARKYFENFETFYSPGEKLRTAPTTGRKDPSVLKTQIEFLEAQNRQTLENAGQNGPLWTE